MRRRFRLEPSGKLAEIVQRQEPDEQRGCRFYLQSQRGRQTHCKTRPMSEKRPADRRDIEAVENQRMVRR